jgi:acylphosphatase
MTKCVKISCILKITEKFTASVQRRAHQLSLEGLMHVVMPEQIKIVVCGDKDRIDTFVDFLYDEGLLKKPFAIEVEPFLKDKDYRGVFRVIT